MGLAPRELRVRRLGPAEATVIVQVAERMRATLVEVLGEARGGAMYTHEWLVDRVHEHLDPERLGGAVFVAELDTEVIGHTVVREEREAGETFGLFSTTYVAPDARRSGVARLLLDAGEAWMRSRDLSRAVTYTDKDNAKLQRLYQERGYTMHPMPDNFAKLERPL